jgi:flagellin
VQGAPAINLKPKAIATVQSEQAKIRNSKMALAIATNNAALNAAASASSVNREMETSMARLSSGKRINSASDDAAGVAISSRLSAEIRGTDQSIRNALDGQALIDTAEGAHKEIENILQRMREVSVQAANDTNNSQDRQNLQAEMDALITEIDRIAGTTTWAGEKLMESEAGSFFSFQVGAATGEKNQIDVSIDGMGANILGFSTTVPSADSASSTPSLNPSLDPSTTVDAKLLQGEAITAAGDVVLNNGLKKATMIIAEKTASTPPAPKSVNIDVTDADSINQAVKDINATIALAGFTTSEMEARVSTTADSTGIIELLGSAVSVTFEEDKINTVAHATIDADGHVRLTGTTKAKLSFTVTATGASYDLPPTAGIDPADIDDAIDKINAATGTHGLVAERTAVDDGSGGTVGVIKLRNAVVGSGAGADVSAVTGQVSLSSAKSDRTPNQLPISSDSDSASSEAAVGTAPRTSVATASEALTTIVAIDAAIQTVNIQRSNLGAVSNRLSHTVNNLTNISSNLSAAQGGIEDADFAHETTMLAKNQILQQASTAMLAQANASKQNVLSLLQG